MANLPPSCNVQLKVGASIYSYNSYLRDPLPFQFPDPKAPESKHDKTIVGMVILGCPWAEIERIAGEVAFERYYTQLDPALKEFWTPKEIARLDTKAGAHVDKWVQDRSIGAERIGSPSLPLVLHVEDDIQWSLIGVQFATTGSVCMGIWTRFGNGRPRSSHDKQTMELQQERISEYHQQVQQHHRSNMSKNVEDQAARTEIRTQTPQPSVPTVASVNASVPSSSSTPSSSSALLSNSHQTGAVTGERSLPIVIDDDPEPGPVETPSILQLRNPSTTRAINTSITTTPVRHTRSASIYAKNLELEAAQIRHRKHVLNNIQRMKQAFLEKRQTMERRQKERDSFLLRRAIIIGRIANENQPQDPWPILYLTELPPEINTPFKPPSFPRYTVWTHTMDVEDSTDDDENSKSWSQAEFDTMDSSCTSEPPTELDDSEPMSSDSDFVPVVQSIRKPARRISYDSEEDSLLAEDGYQPLHNDSKKSNKRNKSNNNSNDNNDSQDSIKSSNGENDEIMDSVVTVSQDNVLAQLSDLITTAPDPEVVPTTQTWSSSFTAPTVHDVSTAPLAITRTLEPAPLALSPSTVAHGTTADKPIELPSSPSPPPSLVPSDNAEQNEPPTTVSIALKNSTWKTSLFSSEMPVLSVSPTTPMLSAGNSCDNNNSIKRINEFENRALSEKLKATSSELRSAFAAMSELDSSPTPPPSTTTSVVPTPPVSSTSLLSSSTTTSASATTLPATRREHRRSQSRSPSPHGVRSSSSLSNIEYPRWWKQQELMINRRFSNWDTVDAVKIMENWHGREDEWEYISKVVLKGRHSAQECKEFIETHAP
ncbi:hypothetical protein BG004_002273 [Podila humilis]|nr:hypothetical protein BG004_002273 [Podila humilis]